MNRKTGLIVLVLGVVLLLAALMDWFGLSQGFNLDVGIKDFSEWPTERIVLAAVGALLAVFGVYSTTRKR